MPSLATLVFAVLGMLDVARCFVISGHVHRPTRPVCTNVCRMASGVETHGELLAVAGSCCANSLAAMSRSFFTRLLLSQLARYMRLPSSCRLWYLCKQDTCTCIPAPDGEGSLSSHSWTTGMLRYVRVSYVPLVGCFSAQQ